MYPESYLEFKRIKDVYPMATLFGRYGIEYSDVLQGGAGTCYIMASAAGVAEFPEYIRRIFLPKAQDRDNGIYALRFYIRGKPWIITVDDYFLFEGLYDPKLYFADIHVKDFSIWANLIEKAWAKMKGTYIAADGGFLQSGIRALTGVPVFSYYVDEMSSN
jgi:calpain-15